MILMIDRNSTAVYIFGALFIQHQCGVFLFRGVNIAQHVIAL